jgi:hypothetical protein
MDPQEYSRHFDQFTVTVGVHARFLERDNEDRKALLGESLARGEDLQLAVKFFQKEHPEAKEQEKIIARVNQEIQDFVSQQSGEMLDVLEKNLSTAVATYERLFSFAKNANTEGFEEDYDLWVDARNEIHALYVVAEARDYLVFTPAIIERIRSTDSEVQKILLENPRDYQDWRQVYIPPNHWWYYGDQLAALSSEELQTL